MLKKITPANSFGTDEFSELVAFAIQARGIGAPLSGYLAGNAFAGTAVRQLEEAWSNVFSVKHSIAVNSATSGLLAAAFASDLKAGDRFLCPAMTMSATAAATCFTGATPMFGDVMDDDFALNNVRADWDVQAIVVTNLFGHPARLESLRRIADEMKVPLIEDNAQSPFAMEHGRYAGTIGHIGVFSLNVHKPLQCGEGGMICTNDDDLAARVRAFINHGEHVSERIGLNLRMPELCAVVALSQLQRGPSIINRRVEQAEAIIEAIGFIPGLRQPVVRQGCTHVYYTIPFLIDRSRRAFCDVLRAEGVPIVEQYAQPVYYLPALQKYQMHCQVAEDLYHKRLFYIENCAWDFTPKQIKQIGAAFKRAAEFVKL